MSSRSDQYDQDLSADEYTYDNATDSIQNFQDDKAFLKLEHRDDDKQMHEMMVFRRDELQYESESNETSGEDSKKTKKKLIGI